MAKETPKPPPAAEPLQTLAEIGGLKTQVFGPQPVAAPVPEGEMSVAEMAAKKIRTSGVFQLTQRFYDNNLSRMFEPGELVTIEDQVPGRTWLRYSPPAAGPVATPVGKAKSAVDQDI